MHSNTRTTAELEPTGGGEATAEELFQRAKHEYNAGQRAAAVPLFRQAAVLAGPCEGTIQQLPQ